MSYYITCLETLHNLLYMKFGKFSCMTRGYVVTVIFELWAGKGWYIDFSISWPNFTQIQTTRQTAKRGVRVPCFVPKIVRTRKKCYLWGKQKEVGQTFNPPEFCLHPHFPGLNNHCCCVILLDLIFPI